MSRIVYRENDGSLDWEEILTFDPRTLTRPQRVALKRREIERAREIEDEIAQNIRDSYTNAPEDDDEFSERFVNPRR